LWTYIAGSICGLLAPRMELLIFARVLQAFGGGAAIAVARAWVMDYFGGGVGAARAIAYSGMTVLIVPMIAPTIGGFAVQWWHWRSIFLIAAGLGMLVLWFTQLRGARRASESPSPGGPHAAAKQPNSMGAYRELLRIRAYVAQVAFGASMMCVAYTFIAGAPHVAIQLMHVTPARYGLLYIIPAIGSFSGFTAAGRLSHRVDAMRIMRFSVFVLCAAELVFAALMLLGLRAPLAMFIPGMFLMFANALAIPSVTSRALAIRPDIAGAASGLIGFAQLATSAIASQIVGSAANQTPFPLIITLGVGCCAALASFFWLQTK
jgi:DHA1 family bicyclomycin/chloramphenicol resistance-like MFS transporter